jgi:hypothetical protein
MPTYGHYIRLHFTLAYVAYTTVYGVDTNRPSHHLGNFLLEAAEVRPQPGSGDARWPGSIQPKGLITVERTAIGCWRTTMIWPRFKASR